MNILKAFCLCGSLATLSCLAAPVFAQQTVPSSPIAFRLEKNHSKLLRGVDSVVLTVSNAHRFENGKEVPGGKDLEIDTKPIREKWEAKLRAAGLKVLSEAEAAQIDASKKDTGIASIPSLLVSIGTGKNGAGEEAQYWWSANITLNQPMVPYSPSGVAQTPATPVDVYSFPVWTGGLMYSLLPSDNLVQSVSDKLTSPLDDFVKQWGAANNKPVFDAFPKH